MKDRDVTLVFGQTRRGKTLWTLRYLRTVKRAIIFDPMDEYEGIRFDSLEPMIEHIQRHGIFRVRWPWVESFAFLPAIALAARRCTLVIEEAQRVIPPGPMLPTAFEDVIYRGGHAEVSYLLVAQRPTTVHIAARSQWDRIITVRQTEVADTRWLRNVTGYNLPFEELRKLEYYEITPHGWDKKLLDLPGRSDRLDALLRTPAPPDSPEETQCVSDGSLRPRL